MSDVSSSRLETAHVSDGAGAGVWSDRVRCGLWGEAIVRGRGVAITMGVAMSHSHEP